MMDTPVWQIYNIPKPSGMLEMPSAVIPSVGTTSLGGLPTSSPQDKLKEGSDIAGQLGMEDTAKSMGDMAGMSKVGIGAKILGLL